MGLMEDIKKAVQPILDFLEVTPAGEPHHSEPYNVPRGDISLIMTGRRVRGFAGARQEHPAMRAIRAETDYLYRIEKPLWNPNKRGRTFLEEF